MDDSKQPRILIRAIGIGRAGISALEGIGDEVERVAIDTDSSDLNASGAPRKILLGDGNATAGDTEAAKRAAAAAEHELIETVSGANVIFIICGLGGGTGSVIAPILSKLISDEGQSTLFVYAFMPLSIEGSERKDLAERALKYLKRHSAAAFSLPNDVLLAESESPVECALKEANEHASKAISLTAGLLAGRGIINVDLPSLRKIFGLPPQALGNSESSSAIQMPPSDSSAFIAYGKGEGIPAIKDAVESLVRAPTIKHCDVLKAESLLINLRCPQKFGMNKMQALLEAVAKRFSASGRIAFGAMPDHSLSDSIEVCVLGTMRNAEKDTPAPFPRQYAHAASPSPSDAISANPPSADNQEKMNSAGNGNDQNRIEVAPSEAQTETAKPKKRFFQFARKHQSGNDFEPKQKIQPEQSEFKFMEMSEQRGFFSDTPPNIRNGEDLDVPTFMRRGIKVSL